MAELRMEVVARVADAADVPALVRVINAAYRVEDFFVHGDRTNPDDITQYMRAPGTSFLVLDHPVHGIVAAVRLETDGDNAHLAMLSVDPARQGKGLGAALLAASEAHCRAAGCRTLGLEVVDLRTELPAFYTARGFVVTGTAPFPVPAKLRREAHLILMEKPLAAG